MYGFYIDEDRRKARRAKWNTVRIISIGFFGVILLGSLLLWLPFSNHQPIRYIDALFTAVTCVCVTGLVTVVPAAQFTVAGKVILLILIQIGGLGIIACTTAFLILVGKRINMKERVVIQEAYGLSTLQGMIRFIERVLWGTFLVEGIGAIGYSFQFIPEYGVAKGIFYSVFHSISAFCRYSWRFKLYEICQYTSDHNYDNNACHSQRSWLSGMDRSCEEYKDDNTVQGKTASRKNDHKTEPAE